MKKNNCINGKAMSFRRWKILLIMKLLAIFILGFILQSNALETQAQNKRLSLQFENKTLKEVLLKLEDQTEFSFIYKDEMINPINKVSGNFKDEKVTDLLNKVLQNTGLTYMIEGRAIVILSNDSETVIEQQKSISGKVTDSSGASLPGVSVVVKGTTTGVIADNNGFYSLSNLPENATLQFSFVGMKTQEIKVGTQTSINVTLAEDAIGIDEVVAIGYGTMKKSDLTGAVSSVKADEIVKIPARTAVEAVQGRVAGVSIINDGGRPGGYAKIRIRGGTSINASSDPLIVVDGFPGAFLPAPEDIASMEVLKDASATAIYGSQGANGVVIITTKRGAENKVKFEFSGSQSIDVMSNPLKVLSGSEFATFINEVYGREFFPNPGSYGAGTNWVDLMSQQGAKSNYNLNLSGGTNKLNYYISGRYFGQKGIVKRNDFDSYSIRSRLDVMPTEKLHITALLQIDRDINNNPPPPQVFSFALKFNPLQDIYNEDGSYQIQTIGDPEDNAFALVTENNSRNVDGRSIANTSLEYEIIPGLKFKTILGFLIHNNNSGRYIPTTLKEGKSVGGVGSMSSYERTNLLNENYLTYNYSLNDKHNFTLMAGNSYQKNRSESMTTGSQNFITDSGLWWNLGGGSVYSRPNSSLVEWVMESWYARFNYSFMNKYLMTFTGRYDGSSRFGANNKWAFFPSAALAWNVKKESFLEDVKFLDQLKVRASYGETGNTAIPSYATLAKFGSVFTVTDNTIVNGVYPSTVSNSDLTWESTNQFDVGVDMSFWNGLLRFNADYYKKTTENLLYSVPLPRYSGFSSITKNFGSIENKGFEFTLGSDFKLKDLKWEVGLNFSSNKNKVLSLPGSEVKYSNVPGGLVNKDPTQILQVGSPVGSFYGYVFDGLYQSGDNIIETGKQPGDLKYRDISGPQGSPDGKIDANDRTIIGNPNPKFSIGFSNNLNYKNFDLSFMFLGVFGNDVYNFTRMELDGLYGKSNTLADVLNRWTPENTNTDIPRANGTHAIASSTRWVEDGSFIRLKDLSLGYNLPKQVISKIGIDAMRISLSGQNLLTFTSYSGYDPEVSTSYSNLNQGLDYESYPNIKSYTLGINIQF